MRVSGKSPGALEQSLHARAKPCWRDGGTEAFNNATGAVDKELGEVPLDGAGPEKTASSAFEMVVERVGRSTVDLDAGEDGKGDGEPIGAEACDFGVGAGLLVTELVAGEAEDAKAARAQVAMERLETGILRCEAATARGVDDQQSLPSIGTERCLLSIDRLGGEVVDAWHRRSWRWWEDTMADLKKGDEVSWGTSQGKTKGTVEKKVTSETKIKSHVAKASKNDPQYVVKSEKTGAKAVHKPEELKKS